MLLCLFTDDSVSCREYVNFREQCIKSSASLRRNLNVNVGRSKEWLFRGVCDLTIHPGVSVPVAESEIVLNGGGSRGTERV